MNCVLLNAQSIRSKFDEFRCFVAVQKPDIVCVTETWVSEGFNGDRLQDYELQGYHMFSYCREVRQGGGILIYVNSLYSATRVEEPLKAKGVESVWIDVKIGVGTRDELRIGVFYRPGNVVKVLQLEIDQAICEEVRRNFKSQCIIMGDFNLRDYVANVETTECMLFRQMFEEELFLHQFVTEPTRLDAILDLVFSDDRELINDLTVCEGLGSSDHSTVTFNVSLKDRPKDNSLMVPNFNRAEFDKIRTDLARIDWNRELLGLDACQAWIAFKSILGRVQSRYIPLKRKRSRKNDKPPWLTPEVREAIRKKKSAFRKMKSSPIESNNRIYRKCRDEVKKRVRTARRVKEMDLARNCNTDCNNFFSFYKLSSSSRSIGPLKSKGELVSRDTDMLDLFSNQFKSVFTIEDQSGLTLLQNQPATNISIDELDTISSDLVRTHLKRVRPNKAEGPDEIYARVLKECEKEVAVPLAIIFSRSLSETEIPIDWKRANVVPVFKKGDKGKVENYRPVSLTSLVCKLFESIIKDTIVAFLNENEIIRGTQHGFMKGRSCLTNLLEFLDVATNSFDQGKQLDVAYLDFSKAFDKVPHKRLGLQLKLHGINNKMHAWIELWLSGRQQRVILNGSKSRWENVLSGVPQGSVLGPLLFLIFVNQIENGVANKVLKFADDLKLFGVIEGERDQDDFQSDLDKLVEWSEAWQMKFNFDKCKVMHIGRVKRQTVYEMGGQRLNQIEKERDLGVTINCKLSASDQVADARSKALRMLGAINRNVSYKSAEVISKLYCAFVRPHLEYCVQAWSPTYEKDCWLLERVQKRATKMINGLSNLEYEDRLESLNMFSLKYRRLRGDLIEVFKFASGQEVGYLSGMFEFNRENRNRRHQHKLVVKQSRTRLRQ